MSWSHEQVEVLIDLYQARPCLYAVKTVQYKNKHSRQKAYEEIQEQLKEIRPNTTVAEIKNKINSLRTNFLNEMRKIRNIKSGAGEEQVYTTTLWYFDLMLFIYEHCTPRESQDTISDDTLTGGEVAEGSEDSTSVETHFYLNEESGDLIQEHVPNAQTARAPVDPSTPSSSKTTEKITATTTRRNLKRKHSTEDDVLAEVSTAISNISSVVGGLQAPQPKKDHISVFADFVSSRLRMLEDPEVQNDTMEDITMCLFAAYKNKNHVQQQLLAKDLLPPCVHKAVARKLCSPTHVNVISTTLVGLKLIGVSKTLKRFANMPKAFSTTRRARDNL